MQSDQSPPIKLNMHPINENLRVSFHLNNNKMKAISFQSKWMNMIGGKYSMVLKENMDYPSLYFTLNHSLKTVLLYFLCNQGKPTDKGVCGYNAYAKQHSNQ